MYIGTRIVLIPLFYSYNFSFSNSIYYVWYTAYGGYIYIRKKDTVKYIIYCFIIVFYVFKNPKSKTMALLTAIYSSSFGNGLDAK